ncbi:tetratricopeptide repeat protein [Leucobacter sp. UCMA 4100]|uniref:tetratricopeptide repeat protein n=1 Tax=Leucobacter sp. UCMA 4100 TaxID=2810534 RepID=UPI0022EB9AA7|nr:tetratricopeptide repeat protein [Leucobacter sp. UCMA 4100]MDA3145990.1 tetratricopeptide repeat protein [Leucobacter sp. UCMA 4100]
MAQFSGGAVDLSGIVNRAQQQSSGAGAQQPGAGGAQPGGQAPVVDVPSIVMQITDDTFEQLMQLSQVVPVVVTLGAPNCEPCDELEPHLVAVTRELEGRVLLATVDAEANPGLQQAFQVQQLPTVVAVIAGQAIPMFQGVQPAEQIREVYAQLLTVAAQQGVTGRVNAPDLNAGAEETAPEPVVNPEHEPALEAIERGDYPAAIEAYEKVLTRAPRDEEAKAALAQVRLLDRLTGVEAGQVRDEAAANPTDIDAQMRVADLDLSGGHLEDAFLRLLELFPAATPEDRNRIRERLLELFEVAGQADPRVTAARARLTNLLFS